MDKNDFLTTGEAAALLGISRIAVFKRIKKGKLRAKKIGRNYVIDRRELGEVFGKTLNEAQKAVITAAVGRAVREYGETLRLLGKE